MCWYKRQGNTLPYVCTLNACKTSAPLAPLLAAPVSFAFSDVSSGCSYPGTSLLQPGTLICCMSRLVLQRAAWEGKCLPGVQVWWRAWHITHIYMWVTVATRTTGLSLQYASWRVKNHCSSISGARNWGVIRADEQLTPNLWHVIPVFPKPGKCLGSQPPLLLLCLHDGGVGGDHNRHRQLNTELHFKRALARPQCVHVSPLSPFLPSQLWLLLAAVTSEKEGLYGGTAWGLGDTK